MNETKYGFQRFSRVVYLVFTSLFLVGVAVQVYLAGMVVVAGQINWSNHISLGHTLGLPLLVMLLSAYLGNIPGRLKRLTWLLLGVYILQADVVIFMRGSAPLISAIHPVLALVDFALGLVLVKRSWNLASEPGPAPSVTTTVQNPAAD